MAEPIENITHLAQLAYLTIPDEAAETLVAGLNKTLNMVEAMNKCDTSDVVPMSHPLDAIQTLRPDQITECNQRTLLQENAPFTMAGLYIVPQVIDTQE